MLHEKFDPVINDHFDSQFLDAVTDKVRRAGISDRKSQEALSHVFAIHLIVKALKSHIMDNSYDPIVEIQRRVPVDSIDNEVGLAIEYGESILGSRFRNFVLDELGNFF